MSYEDVERWVQFIRRTFLKVLIIVAVAVTVPAGAKTLPDFATLVAENSVAVVNISSDQDNESSAVPPELHLPDVPEDSPFHDFLKRFLDEMPQSRPTRSLGSGFVISSDGYILTSAHVIADAKRIIVRFSNRLEREAVIIGRDRRSDVALLKVEAETELPSVQIGDPDKLKVGEWVLAIGSPFGFESSATAGIVSAKGRSLPNENYVPFIQTDVAINPGNSGGPLFNLAGEVVGINAQIYSQTGGFMGLSFAVPINIAIRVADQLKTDGRVKRGWLGVAIQEVNQELAESFGMARPRGALVSEVLADSPAEQAEIRDGDIIVEFGGNRIDRMSELPPLVGRTPIGESVELTVIRDGKPMQMSVMVGELPREAVQPAQSDVPAESQDALLGLTLRNLTASESQELELDSGVIVTAADEGAGKQAGIRVGDLLLQYDGEPIADVDDFRAKIHQQAKGQSAPVLIRRGGRSIFLALRTD
ncbi:MAG: DegQ family serine endoprotease [Gammaproteobacteria bacterium]|nr:DegQ family serine endoprotease [Gammaproteobacteria bacterium]MDH3469634.1 DegQ family serine endoprotease [Gammaproteobacteria bacterium]